MNFAVRTFTADDLASASCIYEATYAPSRDYHTELSLYLQMQPDGWFIVARDGTLVGLGGTVNYGAFAYIGMIAVDPAFQRQGIGRFLMEHLLTWLSDHQCSCALLDASEAGAPLYTRLGFQDAGKTLVFRREVLPSFRPSLPSITLLTSDDFARLVDFDAQFFGVSRMNVLFAYFAFYPERFLIIRGRQGHITGYLLAQPQSIGPWVAQTSEAAQALLQAALCLPFDGSPQILVPEENQAALALVQAAGFQQVRSFRHMRRGDDHSQEKLVSLRRDQIYGLASAAIG